MLRACRTGCCRTTLVCGVAGMSSCGSSLLLPNRRSTLDWAVFVNGAAIRADDMNDGYSVSGHPSDNNAVCLAVAEAEGASGADLLLSIVLAYEVECRLLDAAPGFKYRRC